MVVLPTHIISSSSPLSLSFKLLSVSVCVLVNNRKMDHQNGYGVEVTGLSPSVTEKDLIDFFSFSGTIEHIDIVRSGEEACTAYVMFKDSYSQETAVLLSGATILDQRVCITRWGQHHEEFDFWNATSLGFEDDYNSHPHDAQRGEFNAGEAVTKAQEVVKTMLATGFVLGKDALSKAKAFDESHGVSAAAVARVSQLEQRIGLTDKIFVGLEAVRMTDQRYHVSDTAKSAISATGRTAAAAATSVVNSSYFSSGALWLSGALERAAKAASDLGSRGSRQ